MSILGGVPHNGQGPVTVDRNPYTWDEFFASLTGNGIFSSDPLAGKEGEAIREAIPDKINPDHYTANGIECHSVQRAVLGAEGMAAYWHGCALKYLFRALKKNGREDIRKAIRCLQFWLDENDGKAKSDV